MRDFLCVIFLSCFIEWFESEWLYVFVYHKSTAKQQSSKATTTKNVWLKTANTRTSWICKCSDVCYLYVIRVYMFDECRRKKIEWAKQFIEKGKTNRKRIDKSGLCSKSKIKTCGFLYTNWNKTKRKETFRRKKIEEFQTLKQFNKSVRLCVSNNRRINHATQKKTTSSPSHHQHHRRKANAILLFHSESAMWMHKFSLPKCFTGKKKSIKLLFRISSHEKLDAVKRRKKN